MDKPSLDMEVSGEMKAKKIDAYSWVLRTIGHFSIILQPEPSLKEKLQKCRNIDHKMINIPRTFIRRQIHYPAILRR
jgi:hypothetical protein